MSITARLLRTQADDLPHARRQRSTRDLECEDRILAAAQAFFARHGRAAITLGNFAAALHMSTATIRRHFPDLDAILAELLFRHLRGIADWMGRIPFDAENLHAARRAAYAAYTRTGFGAPTERHLLLIRDRHTLPPDLAESLETFRQSLGDMLAGPAGAIALALLDVQDLQLPQIEAMLAAVVPQAEAAAARPAAAEPRHATPAAPRRLMLASPEPASPNLSSLIAARRSLRPPATDTHPRAGPCGSQGPPWTS